MSDIIRVPQAASTFVRLSWVLAAALWAGGCGSHSPSEVREDSIEESDPIPPPGPHFTVVPLRLETLARITPIGYNNNVFPTAHTYWHTCDDRVTAACHLERQPLLAPGNGVVRFLAPQQDGSISVEGPPGLIWTFGHVTPAALSVGDSVRAGQRIATMFYEHGFDFGLWNRGVTHPFISPERYPLPALHAQHPLEQYPASLRSSLMTRVLSDGPQPLGRVSLDVPGTASGGWFVDGAPTGTVPLERNDHMLLWMGRYVERPDTRLINFGAKPTGMVNFRLAVDPAAPDWETVTPASGVVALKLWNPTAEVLPNFDWPGGTVLIQLIDGTTLRIEWFDTHDPVGGFTEAARLYRR